MQIHLNKWNKLVNTINPQKSRFGGWIAIGGLSLLIGTKTSLIRLQEYVEDCFIDQQAQDFSNLAELKLKVRSSCIEDIPHVIYKRFGNSSFQAGSSPFSRLQPLLTMSPNHNPNHTTVASWAKFQGNLTARTKRWRKLAGVPTWLLSMNPPKPLVAQFLPFWLLMVGDMRVLIIKLETPAIEGEGTKSSYHPRVGLPESVGSPLTIQKITIIRLTILQRISQPDVMH